MTTMQNVAWPTMIVKSPALMPKTGLSTFWITDTARPTARHNANAASAFRATPVTMPGNAIGSTISREIVPFPKNRYRVSAKESRVPRTRARVVAPTPASIEVRRASRGPWACAASRHHFRVRLGGGQLKVRSLLKELMVMTPRGT